MKKIVSTILSIILLCSFCCLNVFAAEEDKIPHYDLIISEETDNYGNSPNSDEAKYLFVDLSYWNDSIDWKTLSKNIDGVILRIGFRGTSSNKINEDSKFLEFYQKASEHSIPVGCYFYSFAKNTYTAKEEANWVVRTLVDNNCKLQLPVYFDFEEQELYDLGKDKCTKIINAFCKRIEKCGFRAGYYTNYSFIRNVIDTEKLSDYSLWYAQWNSSISYSGAVDIWQYTYNGTVNGINGAVDLNLVYAELIDYNVKELTFTNRFYIFWAKLQLIFSLNIA